MSVLQTTSTVEASHHISCASTHTYRHTQAQRHKHSLKKTRVCGLWRFPTIKRGLSKLTADNGRGKRTDIATVCHSMVNPAVWHHAVLFHLNKPKQRQQWRHCSGPCQQMQLMGQWYAYTERLSLNNAEEAHIVLSQISLWCCVEYIGKFINPLSTNIFYICGLPTGVIWTPRRNY